MENAKMQYARKVEETATQIAEIMHTLEDLESIWNKRLYGPGAANAFTNSELQLLDSSGLRSCTADDLYSFVIFASQFSIFLKEGVPAQRDYLQNIQKLRMDL